MNIEILILYFENKNFDVSLKAFAFEILQLGFFLKKRLFALVFGVIIFGENTS
jgi:hypothetical protein